MTTPAIAEQPLAAVALVDANRNVVRATALFLDCCGAPDAFVAALETEIQTVLSGDADQLTAQLDRTTLEIAAVLDAYGTRCALLTIACPPQAPSADGASPLLAAAIDASPAIGWLKDLGGRYSRVNPRFVEQLGVAADRVLGKTEDELARGESVEGLRWRESGGGAKEPLELEYTVDAAHDHPAFAALRFAVRAADGSPVSVCGVATPLARADIARAECARLMRLERWSRSDEAAVRAELLVEWGVTAPNEAGELEIAMTDVEPPVVESDGDHFAAMAAELDAALETSARLDRELAEERRQVMVLREASALAARRAHELIRTITAERARTAELEESLSREQQTSEAVRGELAAACEELERIRAAASEAPTTEQLEAERAQAHEAKLSAEQAQAELATTAAALARERRTLETLRAELRTAEEEVGRARRAASEAVAQAPTHDELEQERRRADRANAALAAARARSEMADAEAKSALAQARAELRRVQDDAAAADEAVNEEKQRVASLRGELSQLRDELARANDLLAERTAELEQAQVSTAKSAGQTSAERKALAKLRAELAAAHAEFERTRATDAKAAERTAVEQRELEKLRGELAAVRDELEEAKRAVAERPGIEELEQERARAAQERARGDALAEQIAELERVRQEAAAVEPEPEPEPAAVDEPADDRDADPMSKAPAWPAAAQRALSAALGTSEDWRGTLKQAVKILGAEGQWDAVVAWLPDGRQGLMKCAATWVDGSLGSGTFETQVWQHRQKLSEEVSGKGHAPQSLLELGSAKDPLLKVAAAEGMGSAVLVPIVAGPQLIGMVQLFSSHGGPPSPELMMSLEAVALQLGATARLLNSANTPHWRFGRL